jgi:hypothetical protein
MKTFFGAISLAFALSVASCQPAHAQEAPKAACQSVQEFTDKTKAGNPAITIEQVADLNGDAVPGLLAFINDAPPPSSVEADQIVIFRAIFPGGQEYRDWLLAMVKEGCVQASVKMPSMLVQGFMPSA